MKIDYAGRLWDFDLLDMSVAQCEAVERYVGKGMGEWANQLAAGSIKSVTALWWVIQKQNGDSPGPMSEPGDDFRPLRLLNAFADAERAEEAAAAEEVPDPPGRGAASTTRARGAAGRSPAG